MDEYDENEEILDDDLVQNEYDDTLNNPATHFTGQSAANRFGKEIGKKLYNVASNTKLGKKIEETIATKFSFKVKLIIVCVGFFLFLIFFIIFANFLSDGTFGDAASGSSCTNLPAIDNVCKSITPSGYETMSIDEYVAGVVSAEVGGMTDENYNTYKASAIAARSYALANATKDSNGNCTVPVGPTFQAYKSATDENILNAAKETSGMVLVKDNAIVSTQYDALCIESEDSDNYYFCQGGVEEEHLIVPRSWLESMRSSSYIAETRTQVHGNGMSQNGAWYLSLEREWDYQKILDYFYGDDGITLASINGASSSCSSSYNGNFKPLESYNLSHDGLNVLDRVLSSSEVNALNEYINKEVDEAGYGTGAGVAAAGQALTYWLEQQGYYLQYRWGGGHYNSADSNGSFIGVNPNWGSKDFGVDYNNGISNPRYYWGMDCSGFVSWVTRTACKGGNFNHLAGEWSYFDGVNYITLSEAKPGDVIDWDAHIQLIVHNNGDGSVIVAEETGGTISGLVFSLVSSPRGKVVDMSSWYDNNCNSSR